MRFLVAVKANKDSEAGVLPDAKSLSDMTKFNEELVKAGVMLAGEGLQPSSKGVRVKFGPGDRKTVIDGPFAETKEFLAGFWIIYVEKRERAYEIAAYASSAPGPDGKPLVIPIELREVMGAPNSRHNATVSSTSNSSRGITTPIGTCR